MKCYTINSMYVHSYLIKVKCFSISLNQDLIIMTRCPSRYTGQLWMCKYIATLISYIFTFVCMFHLSSLRTTNGIVHAYGTVITNCCTINTWCTYVHNYLILRFVGLLCSYVHSCGIVTTQIKSGHEQQGTS